MNDREKGLQLVTGLLIITMIISVCQINPILRPQSNEYVEDRGTHDTFIYSYIIHDPITIEANDNFSSQGFPGNGTAVDPYVIENYNITSTGTCIEIRDTDAFFVIRNCLLKNEANGATISLNYLENAEVENNTIIGDFEDGVYIYWSTNVTVMNNTLSEHDIGVNVYDSTDNIIVNNTIFDSRIGILVSPSGIGHQLGRNSIVDNKINASSKGIVLDGSSDNVLSSNILVTTGIRVGGSIVDQWRQTITPDNLVNGKPIGYFWNLTEGNIDCTSFSQVILANCTGVTVRNALINDNVGGIDLGYSSFCSLINNTISNNFDGIFLSYASNNTLTNNTLSGNSYGLTVDGTSNIVINNTISGNGNGVYFVDAIGNTLTNNTISENTYNGVRLVHGFDNTISDNILSRNSHGIAIFESPDNNIVNNTFLDNGIRISGNNVIHWRHTITPDNLVNGKPIGYFWSLSGGVIESDQYSQIILANCQDVTLENCETTSIDLGHSSFCILENNTMLGNSSIGIRIYHSSNNTISNNTISGAEVGLDMRYSMNNTVADNFISEAEDATWIEYAINSTFVGNSISDCEKGFFIIWGYDNLIANNRMSQNIRFDFACSWSEDNTIMNNTMTGSRAGMEIWSSSGFMIVNNTLSGNSDGLRLFDSYENTVVNNTISMNGDGLYITQSSTNNLFYRNIIAENSRNAIDSVGGNHWNFTNVGNFWSDYGGIGVYTVPGAGGSIDYHPFAYDSEPTTTTTQPTSPTTTDSTSSTTDPTTPSSTDPTPTSPTTPSTSPDWLLGFSIATVITIVVVLVMIVKKRT